MRSIYTILVLVSFVAVVAADASVVGDIDGDGDVDLGDFIVFKANFGFTGSHPADLDGNGVVDLIDYNLLRDNFTGRIPPLAPVPGGLTLDVSDPNDAWLYNLSGSPISVDGFTISSAAGGLDPNAYYGLNDRTVTDPIWLINNLGMGALSFSEANSGISQITEFNLSGSAVIPPGFGFSLGNCAPSGSAAYLSLQYSDGAGSVFAGSVIPALPPGNGDVDGDGDVDLEDFIVLKASLGTTGGHPADFDRDGDVDLEDYSVLKDNFTGSIPPLAPVPGGLTLDVSRPDMAWLLNLSGTSISFDGFTISSASGLLDPNAYDGLSDRAVTDPIWLITNLGMGSLSFSEANPGSFQITEFNLSGSAVILPGFGFPLGNCAPDGLAADLSLEFSDGAGSVFAGNVIPVLTPGDADGDGDVDLDDFMILKNTFGQSPLIDNRADFDNDGDVDLDDFMILKSNFGS